MILFVTQSIDKFKIVVNSYIQNTTPSSSLIPLNTTCRDTSGFDVSMDLMERLGEPSLTCGQQIASLSPKTTQDRTWTRDTDTPNAYIR